MKCIFRINKMPTFLFAFQTVRTSRSRINISNLSKIQLALISSAVVFRELNQLQSLDKQTYKRPRLCFTLSNKTINFNVKLPVQFLTRPTQLDLVDSCSCLKCSSVGDLSEVMEEEWALQKGASNVLGATRIINLRIFLPGKGFVKYQISSSVQRPGMRLGSCITVQSVCWFYALICCDPEDTHLPET